MSRHARIVAVCLGVLAPVVAAGQGPEDPQKGAEPAADPSAARPPRRPTTSAAAKAPVEKGIDFLLRTQRRDGSWGTGRVAPGGTATVTFATPGTYVYRCTDHPWSVGQVIVEP